MKHKIENINLANILYEIGYIFYKAINGVYYSFELRGNDVYIIRPDKVEKLMLSLNTDKKIIYVEDFINEHFELPKGIINIENWQSYICGGTRKC